MSAEAMPSNSEPPAGHAPGVLDLSPILAGCEGKWVALTRDLTKVLASGENYTQCRQAVIEKLGTTSSASFLRVPPKDVLLVY